MSESKTNAECAPVMAAAGPPVLAMTQLLDTGGTLPNQRPPTAAENVRAMVHGFGGDFRAYGAPPCIGEPVSISNNPDLYGILSDAYGGDGATHFNLPNLQGRAAIGAGAGPGLAPVALGEVVDNSAHGMIPALGVTYLIAIWGDFAGRGDGNAAFPTNYQALGEIVAFAGPGLPPWRNWALCDGSLLSIEDNTALFSILDNRFGGDGVNTFGLPDLRGRMIVGTAG